MNTKRLFFLTLSPSQEKMLRSLGMYKFLTTGQLLRLGVMSNRDNINKQLSELRSWKNPLINSIAFGTHPRFWKLEHLHHLTSHGAELLRERFGVEVPIRFPTRNTVIFQQDYFHRIATVNCHIFLQQRAVQQEMEILFFKTYFDKLWTGKKKGFRAESAISIRNDEYLIADALCMLQTQFRKELFAIELYRTEDTSRVHKSLFHHLQALSEGQPSKLFGLQYGSRVLCVFESENNKLMVMKRLCEDERFTQAKSYFLFKTLDELKQEVFGNWELFDGEIATLF